VSDQIEQLRVAVCAANRRLASSGLVTLTFGNASAIDRGHHCVAIKPSGVPYESLQPERMVVVDLDGSVPAGGLRPSSDTPTHLYLYRHFPGIGGIVHTHSRFATMFAQARREIPCLGTTHADHFHGTIPMTRVPTAEEVADDYEANTGKVIVERFADLDPTAMPAVLVAGHGPFVWGPTVDVALENAVALEAVAEMALGTWRLAGSSLPLEAHLLKVHYERKHGPEAWYGQPPPGRG
jgi:L-ribulose-5-phosphate 4-epimerase